MTIFQSFTITDTIQEFNMEHLIFLNSESGPGKQKDSIFVNKLLASLFNTEILMTSSVTGRKSNIHKNVEKKNALDKNKLQFIYGKIFFVIINFIFFFS